MTAGPLSATTMLSSPKRNMGHSKKKKINSCLLKWGHIGPQLNKAGQPIDFEKKNWKTSEKANLKFYIQLYFICKKILKYCNIMIDL